MVPRRRSGRPLRTPRTASPSRPTSTPTRSTGPRWPPSTSGEPWRARSRRSGERGFPGAVEGGVRLERIVPGRAPDAGLVGAVLPRDVTVDGRRWAKGRRLTDEDLVRLAEAPDAFPGGHPLAVLVLEPGDVHEDEAAARLAAAVAGGGLTMRGPIQSRVDLVATEGGVVHVRTAALERLNRIDPLETFTVFD